MRIYLTLKGFCPGKQQEVIIVVPLDKVCGKKLEVSPYMVNKPICPIQSCFIRLLANNVDLIRLLLRSSLIGVCIIRCKKCFSPNAYNKYSNTLTLVQF